MKKAPVPSGFPAELHKHILIGALCNISFRQTTELKQLK